MIQGNNSSYIYLRGTDTDRSSYKDMFYYFGNRRYYSTPSTKISDTSCYGLNITNLKSPEIMYMYNRDQNPLSAPWNGGFIMYYEGG